MTSELDEVCSQDYHNWTPEQKEKYHRLIHDELVNKGWTYQPLNVKIPGYRILGVYRREKMV